MGFSPINRSHHDHSSDLQLQPPVCMPCFKLFILLTNLVRSFKYFKCIKICPFSVLQMINQLKFLWHGVFPSLAIYITIGLHSVSAARCNLTLAAKRLSKRCKSAANTLFSHFAALFRRCTALLVSYGWNC